MVGSMRFGGARVEAWDLNGIDINSDSTVDWQDDGRTFQSSYFMMDITNPEAPPVLLGELVRKAGEAQLGFTTATPTPVVMKSDAGAGDWYLLLGSGPSGNNAEGPSDDKLQGKSSQDPRVAIISLNDLIDQSIGFRIPDSNPTSTAPGRYVLSDSANGFVSDMITIDYDLDSYYKSDAVYFGTVEHGSDTTGSTASFDDDWDGRLYRLVMDHDATGGATTPDEWEASLLLNAGKPITAAPTVATDLHRFWVYFGTGRFFDADMDKPDDAQQSFFGVKEPVDCTDASFPFTWSTVDAANLENVTDIEVTQSSSMGTATVTGTVPTNEGISTFSGLVDHIAGSYATCASDPAGWYRNFTNEDPERNVGQAALLGGLLTFTTYVPNTEVCEQDGEAYLYGLHYQTGTPNYQTVFGSDALEAIEDSDDSLVKESISIGRGLATTPNLHVGSGGGGGDDDGPTTFVQTSTGEIVELPQTNLPKAFRSGRRNWLEIDSQ